jgi:NAD(P)-dependent dehydrogenase (short-subunit alcohol dehydrogenase family)
VIAVSGSASGIGAAVRARLEASGLRVLGIDRRDAEIIADLGDTGGRAAAVAAARERCGDRLDGLVACAGLGPQVPVRELVVSVNYFGAVALLDGLRPSLVAAHGAAVAVSSNSSTLPNAESPLVDACLDDDEATARDLAATLPSPSVYAGSKLALARWVRRQAPSTAWAGAGARLNAVAPGPVQTPMLQEGLDDPLLGPAIRGFPIPTGGFGTPQQVAAAITFLLGPEAAFCCGTVLFVDGGTDALIRSDRY